MLKYNCIIIYHLICNKIICFLIKKFSRQLILKHFFKTKKQTPKPKPWGLDKAYTKDIRLIISWATGIPDSHRVVKGHFHSFSALYDQNQHFFDVSPPSKIDFCY